MSRRATVVVILLASLFAQGCRVWRPISPENLPLPERIRIEDDTGTRTEISDPLYEDGVVVGTDVHSDQTVRVPLDEVSRMEAMFTSRERVVLLLVAAVPLARYGLLLIALRGT